MSIDRKRWAQRAQELKFTQLDAARKQADGWRTGLGGLTALLSVVLIVKGRDTISSLTPGFRWGVVLLLAAGLGMLVAATLLTVRAAAGRPGQDILLSGETLRSWTLDEVRRVAGAIRLAAWLATTAIACLALAIGLTWLGPEARPAGTLMDVRHDAGHVCGEITGADGRQLIIKTATPTVVPLSAVISMKPVRSCK
ncbi:hypothetical protein SMC26_10610 [Actinomadura fulvescens]|uniref:Uncharacterized protein n=1 Tax=Actinomadura fulvescens TaxID=46160 RepID=A0ABN3Q274_9ACTN